MPAQLGKAQRDLVFKPHGRKILQTEPVVVTIDDQEFTLAPINLKRDVPDRGKSLKKALSLMKEKKDWDNLPNLMMGFNDKPSFMGKQKDFFNPVMKSVVVRMAGQAGHQDVILECLRRASNTGLTLSEEQTVGAVFFWIHNKAYSSEWAASDTKTALKWAEMVDEMLEDPKYTGGALKGEADPRLDPRVIGLLLELASMRAAKNGTDEEGKVTAYAQRLLNTPVQFQEVPGTTAEEQKYNSNIWMTFHVPVLHGMKAAQKLLDPASELAKGLKAKSAELESLIAPAKDFVEGLQAEKEDKDFMGLTMYKKLLGSESQ
jgi:hypothetical protein